MQKIGKNGTLKQELIGLGMGERVTTLMQDLANDFYKHFNAYFNADQDSTLIEPEKNRYLAYSNYYKLFIETFTPKLSEILLSRSQDRSLSPDAKFESTRHYSVL